MRAREHSAPVRITHLGHACLLLETGDVRVLVDPGGFSSGFEELTDLSAVLLTHAHPDHVDVEKLPQLLEANDGAVLAAEPELAAQLHHLGAAPLHPGEHLDLGGGGTVRVEAVGGEHALIHPEVPLLGNVGLLVRAAGEPVVFHPGDSYAVVPRGVEVLALPVNAPWATSAMTVDFLRAVAPGVAVPVHDALLSPAGRSVYLGNLGRLAPPGTAVHDTGGHGTLQV